MLGKLNLDEFAMGSSNETSYFGPVISPWRRAGSNAQDRARRFVRRLGGGGRGAALLRRDRRPIPAARSASPRPSPASSASSRPMAAARAGASSPSPRRSIRPGPIARNVRDAAILLRSMAGHDPKDSTSVDLPVPDYEAAVGASIKGMVIGIPKEYRLDGMPAEIDKLWERRRRLAEGGRRRDRRDFAAAHALCAAGLLHRRAGRSLVQSRAL